MFIFSSTNIQRQQIKNMNFKEGLIQEFKSGTFNSNYEVYI